MPIKQISADECWPIRQQVLWPEESLDFVKVPGDDEALHFGLWQEGQLIAVISLFITDHKAQFRKFACLPEFQGRGFGTQLLKHIFQEVKTLSLKSIWCNARYDKQGFYQKFGLKAVPGSDFEKKGQRYIIMERLFN